MDPTMPASDPLQPVPLGLRPSFGFGDRLGVGTPGHVEAIRRAGEGIAPIFPQQSIREMTRTRRSPDRVMADAVNALAQVGWEGDFGADADHLKTPADVDVTVAAGFTFFTIDPSAAVDAGADTYTESELRECFGKVREEVTWIEGYRGRDIGLVSGTRLVIDEEAMMRGAVKYGRAINLAVELADYIRRANESADRDYEIELSVDETDNPTTLAEHFIIADQCLSRGMKLVSLAPRFVGSLEKGIDYIGDVAEFEGSIRDHAAVADLLGPYKLSLHSGSDKLAIYPALARATRGRFHVKTAGTSYLEALRVVAIHDPSLFRRICDFARGRYDVDRVTYHVHAEVDEIPAPAAIHDARELERIYLERWEDVPAGKGFTAPGRQILHCTFGSVLTDETLGNAVRECLDRHPDTYTEVLAVHFEKHLRALQV